jgi:hypothetical protein
MLRQLNIVCINSIIVAKARAVTRWTTVTLIPTVEKRVELSTEQEDPKTTHGKTARELKPATRGIAAALLCVVF